ncbi:hypothetical protein [Paenibacillus tyrfis]|uniref:Uncharacterized protein n=1 Tax=Paenibacillus tyrfis TaxID=1501230 RepID=A0A081NVL5_9BACL|nr:hypothetical protein [Paenibacillus tyrfis]KEQ22488.1 hypothetical protein ET33_23460 [Paenibacillus tyrfis]
MYNYQTARSKKPPVVTFVQVLIYAAALLNIVNGFYSFGSAGMLKKTLCIAMISFGVAAVWIVARLNYPEESRRKAAIALSGILIALRIVEFAVWYNVGFLLGLILPVFVIWRLNSSEAKAWFH